MKFQFLIFLLCLFTLPMARAASCQTEARAAKLAGIQHIIVSFEGLASYGAGFVRKTLIQKLAANYPDSFVSKNYSYGSATKAELCIRDWKAVHGAALRLTIIGHSFGGGIATFKLLGRLSGIYVDEVITLDPRTWSTDSRYRMTKSLEQFSVPQNVGEFYNFYQRGGMPGYRVTGAENFEIKNTAHTRVPNAPEVMQQTRCLLFNDCK